MGKLNRSKTAKRLNISTGHLSDILNGNKECGKPTAKKFGNACKMDWIVFLRMTPSKIEQTLIKCLP